MTANDSNEGRMKRITLRLPDNLHRAIDQQRGLIPRETWIRALLKTAMDLDLNKHITQLHAQQDAGSNDPSGHNHAPDATNIRDSRHAKQGIAPITREK